jgi:predicted protein tyrosine phosphatase
VRWRRYALLVALGALGFTLLVTPLRVAALRAVGHALTVDEPIAAADVVVISVDADGAGVLEASDLVQRGIARRVAVFADPPDAIDQEFLRRGVPYFDAADISAQQLRALGISAVERIAPTVSGTNEEARVLPSWGDTTHASRIVLVCNRDHSRRVRREMRRAMQGHRVVIVVRSSSYSEFDPDTWWHSREGTRIFIVEMEKLLLDVVAHPFS